MADVSCGDDAPSVVNIVIEIQRGSRNKYELDKETGRIFLDRVNGTALGYPADYGYIPDTLCEDGDPLDALLLITQPVFPGIVVPARPVGVLRMVDEGEGDEKLICVPAKDISMDHIKDLSDLTDAFKQQVEHFFQHNKDWKNGWQGVETSFNGWGDKDAAEEIIQQSIERAKR